MTDIQWLSLGYFGGLAILAALGLVLTVLVLMQLAQLFRRWMVLLLAPAVVAGIALGTLTSGRILTWASLSIDTIGTGGGGGSRSVLRALSVAIVALSIALVLMRLFRARRQQGLRGDPGPMLMLGFTVYYIGNSVVNAFLGTVPEWQHNAYYAYFLFAAVYLHRDVDPKQMLGALQLALMVLMAGGLVAMAVRPALVLDQRYPNSWIPGFSIRLWGLSSSPNSLGPLALLTLLLNLVTVQRNTALRWLGNACAIASFVLAQSKTTWSAALVVGLFLLWFKVGRTSDGRTRAGFILAMLALSGVVVSALWVLGPGAVVEAMGESRASRDVSTLTGRAVIWDAAIETWRANPLFGYGLDAWGPLHRWKLGLSVAFSAHNQYLQSLSVAGLVGLTALLGYMSVLGWASWRAREATHGLSAALFAYVLVGCITEAPFQTNTLYSPDLLIHLVIFRLALMAPVRTLSPQPMWPLLRASHGHGL